MATDPPAGPHIAELLRDFPGLQAGNFQVTSPASRDYNCIAWAAGRDDDRWWPEESSWWPPELPLSDTMDNFVAAFGLLGYECCDNGELESGFEKICIYAIDGDPQHAARQLPSGQWTSKMGAVSVDIAHLSPECIEGKTYGRVALFMKRRLPAT